MKVVGVVMYEIWINKAIFGGKISADNKYYFDKQLEEWSCKRGSWWQEDGEKSMQDHKKYTIGVS